MNRPSPRWNAIAPIALILFFLLLTLPSEAQLTISPAGMNFGSVAVGSRSTLNGVFVNQGTSSVTIRSVSVNGTGFAISGMVLPLTLSPGQSANYSASFAPPSAGTMTGSFVFNVKASMSKRSRSSSGASGSTTVPLSGTGTVTSGQLAANPTSLSFGTVALGLSASQYQSVTNNGSANVTISQAAVSSSAFKFGGVTLPLTLAAGQSLTFSMTFTPAVSGTTSGNLTLTSDASNPTLSVALAGSGSAPGQLSVNPGSMDFGSVIVGQSATKTATVTASGSSVTINAASPSTSEFAVGGMALPMILNAGQSASYSVTFTPQLSGATSATLQFASNATTVAAETLSGSGAAAPSHSVDLFWNASTSTVAGYNVYRGTTAAGPFTKLNSALDASTNFTDSNVQSGTTYYYVATAVDTSGAESGYSTAVSAAVPTP